MSSPYPGTGLRPGSQNDDYLAGLATRYIEQNLDRTVDWDEVRQYLETQHGRTTSESARGLLLAVLDIEWTGAMQYDVDRFRRPWSSDRCEVRATAGGGKRSPRPRLAATVGRQAQPDNSRVLP
jgi:hypothetical protein